MMKSENAQHKERPQLRLVHGGAPDASMTVHTTWRSAPASQTSQAADADRLRHAILCAVVEEVGQTVDEVLRELNEKLDSEKFDDVVRCSKLNHYLDRRGLMYFVAPPHLDLDCNGYLTLSNVKRLLAHHPELTSFRPEEHHSLTIGELPLCLRRNLAPAKHSGVSFFPSRKSMREYGEPAASVARYFDAVVDSVWRQESNRLRHAILTLQLEQVGSSVMEALDELCLLGAPQTEGEHYRVAVLHHALESIGLGFRQDSELPVPGYLSLAWPDRLLREYPQLASLHPGSWQSLQIA